MISVAVLVGACNMDFAYPTHPVTIASDPPGATCEVKLEKHTLEKLSYGPVVTPGVLTLPKRPHLVATCRKDGYRDGVAPLSRTDNAAMGTGLALAVLFGPAGGAGINPHTIETSVNVTLTKLP
jgi:hypothetical protein